MLPFSDDWLFSCTIVDGLGRLGLVGVRWRSERLTCKSGDLFSCSLLAGLPGLVVDVGVKSRRAMSDSWIVDELGGRESVLSAGE